MAGDEPLFYKYDVNIICEGEPQRVVQFRQHLKELFPGKECYSTSDHVLGGTIFDNVGRGIENSW